ncbi:SDR family oxidoreductase [Pseudobacteriovorax antillogorgiicola]|uniref:Nucleoside-diphosphate-sugar epimerase n=1 Tax=Pseudobacteriovorax antillogorgiicola TaxID=1513793 RepID=A0A1Y6BQL6_9BACT|nr:SDR family oxidoreductase [Pseudobacteriovorax antillogorgiicola]TCS55299.1 nucleoside-diphosphate-sugar epimerase [Pseudobacteriovorax antillogorgiicola]SMF14489.1 Nucleoside-diphosphate-sugar epimerase [Pseudobacteriovorax antillogorgiicola]
MKRILVAGPGYVGLPLADALAKDHHVIGLQRSSLSHEGMESISCDLAKGIPQNLPACDEVYFCLAPKSRDLSRYRSTYFDGVKNLIKGLPQVPQKLFFISSTSVYGQKDGELVDETMAVPELASPYGRILLEAEQWVLDHVEKGFVIRFGGIYGPGRTRMVHRFKSGEEKLTKKPIFTNRIHRSDCVRALLHLRQDQLAPGIYNGVDSEPADKNQMIRWACDQWQIPLPDKSEEDLPQNKRVSNGKLLNSGFSFLYPSFREGYSELIQDEG